MENAEITKGIAVDEGYAKKGEMVVPGMAGGCFGHLSRKAAYVGRVVRLEKAIAVIAFETAVMFYKRNVGDLINTMAEEEGERIRRLYAQVQALPEGTLVHLPSDQEEPVVEPLPK